MLLFSIFVPVPIVANFYLSNIIFLDFEYNFIIKILDLRSNSKLNQFIHDCGSLDGESIKKIKYENNMLD